MCPSLLFVLLISLHPPFRYDSFGRLTNVTFPTGQVSSFRSDTDSSVHVQVETSSKDDVTITTNLSASGAFYTLLQGESGPSPSPKLHAWDYPSGNRHRPDNPCHLHPQHPRAPHVLGQTHTRTYSATFPSSGVALQLFSASFSASPLAVQRSPPSSLPLLS